MADLNWRRVRFYYDDLESGTWFFGTPEHVLIGDLALTEEQVVALERAIIASRREAAKQALDNAECLECGGRIGPRREA